MTTPENTAPTLRQPPFAYFMTGFVVLVVVLCGLFYYKWGGAMRTIGSVRTAGTWTGSAAELTTGGMLRATVFYFGKIWLALVYGLLIGAAVRAFLSPKQVAAFLGQGSVLRRQVAGGLTGVPLMLCSCCMGPVFAGVYERGARLGPALAVMLASPVLNPAALALTFILFPSHLAATRLATALAAVLALPPVLERICGRWLARPLIRRDFLDGDDGPRNVRDLVLRFGRSLGYLMVTSVPLVVVGVLLSSLILPASLRLSTGGALLAIVPMSGVAVLVALPTFFEIPLAMLLLQLGAPGAAVAMLVAGPAINLPSLLVLARETNPKVAASVAVGVWALAVLAGMAVTAGSAASAG